MTAESLRDAEVKIVDWQTQWDTYAKSSAEAGQAAEVERTRLDLLDKQAMESGRRLELLREEKRAANVQTLSDQSTQLASEHDTHKEKVETFTQLLIAGHLGCQHLTATRRGGDVDLARAMLRALVASCPSVEAAGDETL